MRDRHVLHDGEPEPSAAGSPRTGRVDAVEAFEDPLQVTFGYADALVRYADLDAAVTRLLYAHHDPCAFRAVHDGVLEQVPDRGHQQVFLAEDGQPADADRGEGDAAGVRLHPAPVKCLGDHRVDGNRYRVGYRLGGLNSG